MRVFRLGEHPPKRKDELRQFPFISNLSHLKSSNMTLQEHTLKSQANKINP